MIDEIGEMLSGTASLYDRTKLLLERLQGYLICWRQVGSKGRAEHLVCCGDGSIFWYNFVGSASGLFFYEKVKSSRLTFFVSRFTL